MRRPPRQSPNRLGLIILVVFLGLLGGAGVAAFKTLTFVSSVSTADLGDNIRSIVTNAPPSSAASGAKAPTPSGRINVLLLGYGGEGHEGALLTDSIMLLTLDQQTRQAAMISVPRDLWVKIPYAFDQGGFYKLNAAYAIGADDDTFKTKRPEYTGSAGGGNLASAVVDGVLGVKIDYWVAVDFHAFKSVVDALGGVDVDVGKTFTDYYYPRNDNPDVDPGWMTIHFNAGMQHMNGERAIEYARSRHSLDDGTDFGRSRRQQRLLLAIKDKALTPEGVTKVFGLMDALSKDFRTNMNVGQMRALADLAKSVDAASIDRVSIDNTNYLLDAQSADGQDILIPEAKSWEPLRNHIASLLLDSAVRSENATVQLSGINSVAAATTSMLRDIGLQTLPPSYEAGFVKQTEIHDLSQGKDPSTVNYLANMFDAKIFSDTPGPSDRADIKIVLGRSYRQAPSVFDSIDPTVRARGSAPPVVETPRTEPKPAVTPSAAPAASASAAPSLSPVASASASTAPTAVPKPALTPAPAGRVATPATTPSAIRR